MAFRDQSSLAALHFGLCLFSPPLRIGFGSEGTGQVLPAFSDHGTVASATFTI
jgi:hypothetical protein